MRRSLGLLGRKSHGWAARNEVDCRKLSVCCSRLAAVAAISATLASFSARRPLRCALARSTRETTPTATMAPRTPKGTTCSRKRRMALLLDDRREPQRELGAARRRARHLDGGAYLLHVLLDHRQPDADAPGAHDGVAVASV